MSSTRLGCFGSSVVRAYPAPHCAACMDFTECGVVAKDNEPAVEEWKEQWLQADAEVKAKKLQKKAGVTPAQD